jgi:hypothetical protein
MPYHTSAQRQVLPDCERLNCCNKAICLTSGSFFACKEHEDGDPPNNTYSEVYWAQQEYDVAHWEKHLESDSMRL